MELTFVTTNAHKFESLAKAINPYDIELSHKSIETPEIQDINLESIVEFSANWALKELHGPLLVNDFGYFISALNGFPGPFSKQVIEWFTLDDWMRLLSTVEDRTLIVKWAYALAAPNHQTKTIVFTMKGQLASNPGKEGGWNDMHRFYIPQGFNVPYSDLSELQKQQYQQSKHSFSELATFIKEYLNK